MKGPFLSLELVVGKYPKRFSASILNTKSSGFVLVLYLNRKPIFNLVANKHAECPTPTHIMKHSWLNGRVLWHINER